MGFIKRMFDPTDEPDSGIERIGLEKGRRELKVVNTNSDEKAKSKTTPSELYKLLDKKDKYVKLEKDIDLDIMFKISFPYRALLDENEIDVMGMPMVSINGRRHKVDIERIVTRPVTIKRMVYWYSEDIPMSIFNADDIKKLYDILTKLYSKYNMKYASMATNDRKSFAYKLNAFAETIRELNPLEFSEKGSTQIGNVEIKSRSNFYRSEMKPLDEEEMLESIDPSYEEPFSGLDI